LGRRAVGVSHPGVSENVHCGVRAPAVRVGRCRFPAGEVSGVEIVSQDGGDALGVGLQPLPGLGATCDEVGVGGGGAAAPSRRGDTAR
jgi:hypothetical protein